MTSKQRSSLRIRLAQLMSAWGLKTGTIGHLNGEMAAIGHAGDLKPSLFAKLSSMLEQIGLLREKEQDIIYNC